MRVLMGVLTVVALALGGSSAQGAPNGVSEQSVSVTTLDVSTSGTDGIAFGRLVLAPEASVSLSGGDAPSLYFVTEGEWVVRSHEVAAGTPSDAATADGTPVDPGAEPTLGPNTRLLVPPRTVVEASNVGVVPVVVLTIGSAGRATEPSGNGVTWQSIGDPIRVSASAIRVTMTRLVVDPGSTTASLTTDGPELLDVRSGPVVLSLNPGQVSILRAEGGEEALEAGYEDPAVTPEADPDAQEEAAGSGLTLEPPGTPLPGTAIGLRSGDSVVLATGATRVLRAPDDTQAVVLIIAVVPADSPPATPNP